MKLISFLSAVIMSATKEERQSALYFRSEYGKKWKLQINSGKTKVIVFGHRKMNNIKFNFCFKYRGVVFNFSGSFKSAITAAQATRAMFAILAKCRTFDLSVDVALELLVRLPHNVVCM